ncbi:hypothetical protein [Pedobacter gandavensis]|uniref:HK97 gp10 family phage protein n=1 Tax=Pedobacter gandavensis TaxID=2679963 RepID=A0ABR6EVG7_9SPHI|nr:hypothetical protein [Pedobacter gandavensis]MBB2149186.1 hypothetical protein [Pedobacter gandavensis]
MENIEQLNTGVKNWGGQTIQEIKSSYDSLVSGKSGDGKKSLKLRTRKNFGEIEQLIFGFSRYLVWIHKGASKGHGGAKGSTWFHNGARVKTNPNSFGKMDTQSRVKKEFMNPVLDKQLPKLADVVAGFKADQAIKSIQIK